MLADGGSRRTNRDKRRVATKVSALEGLRIVELGRGMAGAMAGLFLAENGATVVKVEPPSGVPYRHGPIFTPAPIACYGAANLAAQGLLAGVHARAASGKGQRAATSLVHALVTYDMTSGYGHRIHTPQEGGKAYGVMPLGFMTAETKDGRYLQMCSRAPHLFRNWMRVLGMEHLYDDPAY